MDKHVQKIFMGKLIRYRQRMFSCIGCPESSANQTLLIRIQFALKSNTLVYRHLASRRGRMDKSKEHAHRQHFFMTENNKQRARSGADVVIVTCSSNKMASLASDSLHWPTYHCLSAPTSSYFWWQTSIMLCVLFCAWKDGSISCSTTVDSS